MYTVKREMCGAIYVALSALLVGANAPLFVHGANVFYCSISTFSAVTRRAHATAVERVA